MEGKNPTLINLDVIGISKYHQINVYERTPVEKPKTNTDDWYHVSVENVSNGLGQRNYICIPSLDHYFAAIVSAVRDMNSNFCVRFFLLGDFLWATNPWSTVATYRIVHCYIECKVTKIMTQCFMFVFVNRVTQKVF